MDGLLELENFSKVMASSFSLRTDRIEIVVERIVDSEREQNDVYVFRIQHIEPTLS